MNRDLEQFKIEREQTAWRIMRVMVMHGALPWTRERLTWELMVVDSMVQASLAWLSKQTYTDENGHVHTGFVECRGDRWYKTTTGENAYLEQIRATRFRTGQSTHEFRTEALTGMDARGNQSEFTWAALPSPGDEHPRPDDKLITDCARMERIRMIADAIGETVEDTIRGLNDGTVWKCRGIDGVIPHWARFYPDRTRGKRRRHLCQKCWRKMMKHRRMATQ